MVVGSLFDKSSGHAPDGDEFRRACREGDLATVRLLAPGRVNTLSSMRHGGLHLAFWGRHMAVVDHLLGLPETQVNLAGPQGETLLHSAVQAGNLELVGRLLRRPDLNVQAEMEDGASALWLACHAGDLGMVRLLLTHQDYQDPMLPIGRHRNPALRWKTALEVVDLPDGAGDGWRVRLLRKLLVDYMADPDAVRVALKHQLSK